jgi:hypothetical protein
MSGKILRLPQKGPNSHPLLAKLEEGAAHHALHDAAILCEVAGVSWSQNKPEILTQYAALLMRLHDTNLSLLPRKALKVDDLALCAGGGLFPYYEKNFLAKAETDERLDLANPQTRTEVIDRALRDTSRLIPALTEHLMQGENRRFGHYYATGDNAAQLFVKPELGLQDHLDARAIFNRVNAALESHGLAGLPSPYVTPPPRGSRPQMRPL